ALSWSPANEVLSAGSQRFATMVDELTGGRLKIEVFAAGELVPPFGVFDACSQGTIEAFNSSAVYWAAKDPATQWFAGVPFGLNAQGIQTWYHAGDGLRLWEETYAPFGLVPRRGGSTGVQMGGWFRKKIDRLADLKGLKLRMPGLGGRVLAKAGATPMLLPLSQALQALEQGTIDGAEFVGPHDDLTAGFYRGARYYYYPGWHDAGGGMEFTFNRKAYESLPVDLRRALDYTALAVGGVILAEYEAKNALALRRLRTEFKARVEVLPFPAEVMKALKKLAAEVLREESEKSPMARKVYASYTKFQELLQDWGRISEGAYHNLVAG
ncbi:MAG: ABC transporter substrate-binding protein, partial [Candidatus Rokubacteria bacterium]|nr:ABC transporter substrate-binding protein [Candidatus Rokubacteria bacterium]